MASAAAPAKRIRHSAFEILNCGLKASKDEVSQALHKIGIIGFTKITKAENEPKCKVTFTSDEDKNDAMRVIEANPTTTDEKEGPWRVKSVFVKRPFIKQEAKEAFQQKRAADAVAPWREIPYSEQLQKKESQLKEAIDTCFSSLGLVNYEVNKIAGSPATSEYRNKLDFTIGLDSDGKPCAGFRIGAYKQGGTSSFRVEVTDECLLTCPKIGLEVASELSKLIQASPLPVYDQDMHTGFWRALSVRWSERTKELMVLVRCSPDATHGEAEMKRVCDFFKNDFSVDGVRVTAMMWQWWEGIAFQAPPESGFIQLFGKDHIEEDILGMRFKVSAGAFFQVNTRGCEVLFEVVRGLVRKKNQGEDAKAMLLDVCCGTGVIGLLCADSAHAIAGVELSMPAVEDARKNAEANCLSHKTKFVCAKAESVLSRILTGVGKTMMSKKDTVLTEIDEKELGEALEQAKECTEIVAVVDPPRAGLHPSVLKALLRCSAVNRIIYVSCNPTGSFIENAKELCGSGPIISNHKDVRATEGIKSFKPVSFYPVDMFPHTEHCELVCEFVRQEDVVPSVTKATSSSKRMKHE